MKTTPLYAISALSLLLSAAALTLSVVSIRQSKTASSSLTATQIEAMVNKTISKAVAGNSSKAKAAASETTAGTVRKEKIDEAVAKRISQELDNVDLKELVDKNVEKKLKKAYSATIGMGSQNKEIDVSDIADTAGKIKRILEEFEGTNSYMSDNKLVKQITAMGEEAIEPLIKELIALGNDHSNWAKKMAIEDGLKKLLTKDNKEIILENFEKNGILLDLVKKYNLTDAEDTIFKRIRDNDMTTGGRVFSPQSYFDTALQMNKERAVTAMLDYVNTADSHSKTYPLKKLSELGVDVTEPLRNAALNARSSWEKSELSPLLLRNGMPEGLTMAAAALKNTEEHSDHWKQQVADTVRLLTDAKGDYKEMADWLEKNGNSLKWNPATKRFE